MPPSLFWAHPRISIFDRPSCHVVRSRSGAHRISLAGLPFVRGIDARRFGRLLAATRWSREPADLRLLCLHQTIEGARVKGHTFGPGDDVVPVRAIPAAFAAILAGHIHRRQHLLRDGAGRPLPAPVIYAGSTERTSFAEREDPKGSVLLRFRPQRDGPGRLTGIRWVVHRTRSMKTVRLDLAGVEREQARSRIRSSLKAVFPPCLVRLELEGTEGRAGSFSIRELRELAPAGVTVVVGPGPGVRVQSRREKARSGSGRDERKGRQPLT